MGEPPWAFGLRQRFLRAVLPGKLIAAGSAASTLQPSPGAVQGVLEAAAAAFGPIPTEQAAPLAHGIIKIENHRITGP